MENIDELDLNELKKIASQGYGFYWSGKGQAIKDAENNETEFIPYTENNMYIEADNIIALKRLQKEYDGKIKMIYIDPPYNTGKKFIYNDKYQKKTGKLSYGDGRHSDWLNMIYPRLKVARDLLTDDGVIFISIDDNEVHNLRKICDEIFGEESFIAIFPWKKRSAKSDVPFGVSQDYEWILAYTKKNFIAGLEFGRKYYSSDDYPNDRWRLSDLTTQKVEADRPNSAFDLVDPKTGKIYKYNPNRLWGITKDTFEDYYSKGKIVFPDDYDFLNITIPSYRVFESEDKKKALEKYGSLNPIKAMSTHLEKSVGMNTNGNKEIIELLNKKVFSYPKPSSLIEYLISSIPQKEYIVLDFFSGSATTAHATMQLNAEDGGNRKYIMVQLPEPTPKNSEAEKAGYKNICEIGKERIRRAGEKIKADETLPLENREKLSIDFEVIKI